jgi:hypothetical protein
MGWILELVLVVLLAATLYYATRLERALGTLKRDRAALDELAAGFDSSTRDAEQGLERLRATTEGAGRHMVRQIESARALKDDLAFLLERGERAADRLDALVRTARPLLGDARAATQDAARPDIARADPARAAAAPSPPGETPEPRLRSQAERDLLKVLRMAR